MANIFDTSKYILKRTGTISSMKLQKLCYYALAWSLVWDERPIFNEDFYAWETGPVCIELFNELKGKYSITIQDITGEEKNLTKIQRTIIDTILAHYNKQTDQYLSQLTQMEYPWIKARNGNFSNVPYPNIITKQSIKEYYSSLK